MPQSVTLRPLHMISRKTIEIPAVCCQRRSVSNTYKQRREREMEEKSVVLWPSLTEVWHVSRTQTRYGRFFHGCMIGMASARNFWDKFKYIAKLLFLLPSCSKPLLCLLSAPYLAHKVLIMWRPPPAIAATALQQNLNGTEENGAKEGNLDFQQLGICPPFQAYWE